MFTRLPHWVWTTECLIETSLEVYVTVDVGPPHDARPNSQYVFAITVLVLQSRHLSVQHPALACSTGCCSWHLLPISTAGPKAIIRKHHVLIHALSVFDTGFLATQHTTCCLQARCHHWQDYYLGRSQGLHSGRSHCLVWKVCWRWSRCKHLLLLTLIPWLRYLGFSCYLLCDCPVLVLSGWLFYYCTGTTASMCCLKYYMVGTTGWALLMCLLVCRSHGYRCGCWRQQGTFWRAFSGLGMQQTDW